jgi:hypothetical protein
MNLSSAYPSGELRRVATLDRETATISIADEWGSGTDITEHFVIAGRPALHEPGLLVVETLGGATARLTWDPALGKGALESRPVDDELLAGVWGPVVHRLIIETTTTSFELTLARGEHS